MIRKPPEPISREEQRELVVQIGSPDRAVEDAAIVRAIDYLLAGRIVFDPPPPPDEQRFLRELFVKRVSIQ